MSNMYADMFRAKLAQPPPPPGWSNPDPMGESHYVTGHEGSMPGCGLKLYYGGDRFEQPPEGSRACEDCKAAHEPR